MKNKKLSLNYLAHNSTKNQLDEKPKDIKPSDEWKDLPLRISVYFYISADDDSAEFNIQQEYYKKWIIQYPHWTLVDFYAEKRKGTNHNPRIEFNRLIADAKAGKFDLIIIKSLSRFSRNITECLSAARNLLRMNPPVGLYFESESFCTLTPDAEVIMLILTVFAEEESNRRSLAMKTYWKTRKEQGCDKHE